MMEPLVVRRSAWRMWLMGLAAVPMVVVAVDLLTRRRIIDGLRARIFDIEDASQFVEPRDLIWAWMLLVFGLILTGWALKELVTPTAVVKADQRGVTLRLRGPLGRSDHVPWEQLDDLGSATIDDDGDRLPVMWLKVVTSEGLPSDPWGARWIDEHTLALLAVDWEMTAIETARGLADRALASLPDE